MKKILLVILPILLIFQGCSTFPTKGGLPVNTPSVTGQKASESYIDPGSVEWLRMQGGLGITTKVLFSSSNKDKIAEILKRVNAAANKRESAQEEINAVHSMARPIGIAVRMKDGSDVFVWPSYKVTSFKDGWSATPQKDRFVLAQQEGGKEKYYTLDSADVASYLAEGWRADIPMAKEMKVDSGTAVKKDGRLVVGNNDTVTVSGDGCTEKEVSVYLSRNGENSERCLVGKVEPSNGSWLWMGVIGRVITTLDGKTVTLEDGLYDISANAGVAGGTLSGVIELRKGFYRELVAKDLKPGSFPGAVFAKDNNAFIYNENTGEIKNLCIAPAFYGFAGLSPDKRRIAFACGFEGERAIEVYDREKGSILDIPLVNQYAEQSTDAWWHNDRVIIVTGHVNPSAEGYVTYDAVTGKELSATAGGFMAAASDGRYILFRLTPHWTDNPPPDNICGSKNVTELYTVKNREDKINNVKLSKDDKKLLWVETLKKNGAIRINLADINSDGTVLSNRRQTEIDAKGGKFLSVFVSEDFTRVSLGTGKDRSSQDVTVLEIKDGSGFAKVEEKQRVVDNKDIEGEKNSSQGSVDPARLARLTKAVGEFFKATGSLEDMGITGVAWF